MLVVTKAQITLSGVLNTFTKYTVFLTAPEPQTDTEIVALFVVLVHSYCSGGFHFSLEHLPSY